jgi:hypothetical protein
LTWIHLIELNLNTTSHIFSVMFQSQSKPVSNLIGNCPDCDGLVRIPLEAGQEATVRCPHCKETFSISAVLEQIPLLEIVEPIAPTKLVPIVDRVLHSDEEGDRKGKFVVPTQLVKGAKRRRGRRQRESGTPLTAPAPTPAYSVNSENQGADLSSSDSLAVTIQPDKVMEFSQSSNQRSGRSVSPASRAYPKVQVHSSQRHRRLKPIRKNTVVEAFKIVFGAILAFPVAYLILLWVLGQDPFHLATPLSRSVPFVVPKSMRPKPTFSEPVRRRGSVEENQEQTQDLELSTIPSESSSSGSQEPTQEIPDVAPDVDNPN